MKDAKDGLERDEALADLRRLTTIILDNLEEGSLNKLMDPKEMRLLGGTAIRSIRLYLKTLEGELTKRSKEKEDDSPHSGTENLQEDQTAAGK